MPQLTEAAVTELIGELIGRESFAGLVVLELDLTTPAHLTSHVVAKKADDVRRVGSYLREAADQIEHSGIPS